MTSKRTRGRRERTTGDGAAKDAAKGATKDPVTRPAKDTSPKSGLGVLCAEAQADGVPCLALGVECEHCGRAHRATEPCPETPDATGGDW